MLTTEGAKTIYLCREKYTETELSATKRLLLESLMLQNEK